MVCGLQTTPQSFALRRAGRRKARALHDLVRAVDKAEQRASRQASRNSQLALALLDQSSRSLQALTRQALPVPADTYGRKGGMRARAHPQAAFISGRL